MGNYELEIFGLDGPQKIAICNAYLKTVFVYFCFSSVTDGVRTLLEFLRLFVI